VNGDWEYSQSQSPLGVSKQPMFKKIFNQIKHSLLERTAAATKTTKPELKQFGKLTVSDFQNHPVWINCHVKDYDEPWYNETNEETFRPWDGDIPISASEGMFLVHSSFIFADGSKWDGFITPVHEQNHSFEDKLKYMQPCVFISEDKVINFGGGMFGFKSENKAKVYEITSKSPNLIFPVRFQCKKGLTQGIQSGTLKGFYWSPDMKNIQVES
jgi:hypothetical protein